MKKKSSVKDICEGMWYLENKYNLLNWDVDGVKLWQAYRIKLYYYFAQKIGVLSEPHPVHVKPIFNKFIEFFKSIFFAYPFSEKQNKDFLIFDHIRKVKVDSEYIDIYTHYLINDLKLQGASFEVYEQAYLGCHWTNLTKERKYLDIINLYKFTSLFNKFNISNAQLKFINHLNHEINELFSLKINLISLFPFWLKKFKGEYRFFKKLIMLKKPKLIYVVVGYVHAPLIKAAKDCHVKTIELQHGNFSNYHLGYSYPGCQSNLEYFSDKFWVWNEFWKEMCCLPLKQNDIEVYPFQYIHQEKRKYVAITKKQNQVLILSQAAIGRQISDQVLNYYHCLRDLNIIYRLHPSEFKEWKKYPSLVKLSAYPNVKIVDNNDDALYKFMAESKYVIGVFSTAIYEALEFGCDIILVELPGIEYMETLLSQKKARLLTETMCFGL